MIFITMKSYKILLAEDDAQLARTIVNEGLRHNLKFDATGDGNLALSWLKSGKYPMAVIDLGLKGSVQGEDLIAAIKELELETMPIVITGAIGSQRMIDSLNNGALAYLRKPCSFAELKAQIDALRSLKENLDPILTCGKAAYNLRSRLFFYGKAKPVLIDGYHGRILEFLMSMPNNFRDIYDLYEEVWEDDPSNAKPSTVRRIICELRARLDSVGAYDFITTEQRRSAYAVLQSRS